MIRFLKKLFKGNKHEERVTIDPNRPGVSSITCDEKGAKAKKSNSEVNVLKIHQHDTLFNAPSTIRTVKFHPPVGAPQTSYPHDDTCRRSYDYDSSLASNMVTTIVAAEIAHDLMSDNPNIVSSVPVDNSSACQDPTYDSSYSNSDSSSFDQSSSVDNSSSSSSFDSGSDYDSGSSSYDSGDSYSDSGSSFDSGSW